MKPIYVLLFGLISLTWPGLTATAQSTLTGTVHDNAGKPVPFASVALLNARDSSVAKGTATNQQGQYAFERVGAGQYRVRASAVGYQKAYSTMIVIDNEPITAPMLILVELTGQLNTVQVTAKKPFVEQQIDRMVVNVAGSIVGSGSTVLQVLEKSPGVTVDYQNDRLQLRGKDGVIILIDGRQTYLSAADAMALLRTMPGDNVVTIELITNPSARYDAAGNAGIINIRLKKDASLGTNGTLTGAIGTGRFDRERAGLTLNHRTNHLNLFGNYSLNRSGNYWNFRYDRNQTDPSPTDPARRSLTDQFTNVNFRDLGHTAKAGFDWMPADQTTVGLVWTGLWSSHTGGGPAGATFRRSDTGPPTGQTQTDKNEETVSQDQVVNLNLTHRFGKTGGTLTADLDGGHFTRRFSNNLGTQTLVQTADFVPPPERLLVTQPTTVDILTAKGDYNYLINSGFWKGWNVETGLKAAWVNTDNDLHIGTGTATTLTDDPTLRNRFQYRERVLAAYASMSGKWGDTQVQVGLRAEQTHSAANSLTQNLLVERTYLNLFPTVFVSQPLSHSQTLTGSYSYRIDRPNYQNLNPARSYVDPFAFSQGNPFLRPQFTHALELRYGRASGLFFALGANYTTNLMFFTIKPTGGNQTYVTTENLGQSHGYLLTAGWPITVRKGWQLQTTLVGFYNRFRYDYEGTTLQISNVAGRLNAANAVTFGRGWTGELTGWLSTPAVNGIWQSPWLGSVDAGVQKNVSAALKLKLSLQDIFHTNRFVSTTNAGGLTGRTIIRLDTRVALLNLTYSFGNQQVKAARQRKIGSEDETRRTN